ncbi:SusC/RagA family TonB-linked outer membrane protein [Chitinophaga sp.]|uniref:SusC/RagA family TonB-linked outer membrane protein n=1 Tax=Chitinophaga sp. TaxID=1869181 RepID=UPI002C974643|nr:SusC/RagA family TonB-linked outer membrane protein [Chitinophaga sp.]HWV65997.1 SusC/RagA family TonB-linked outer membrane protein [Chitinophaga sp.]
MKNVILIPLLLLIAGVFPLVHTQAQTRPVSGKVVSQGDKQPLPGVSIGIKGKNTGTQTTADGTFTITAGDQDILLVRYIGYETKEVPVGSSQTLVISLKSSEKQMDEVVVIGYGTQSRRNVTSSIAKLDKEVLANAPRSNIGSALQGTVAGLQVVNTTGQPGASPVMVLRGGASINTPGAPLVIVDGIIRAYNDVASEDIASIELLKDAAATAIYGARANNGVILITTKQGKAGSAQVSYKFTGGYNQERQGYQYMNAKDYIYYTRLGYFNSGRTLAQVNSSRGLGLSTNAADLASFDIRPYNTANSSLLGQGWDTVGDPYGGTIIFKDHGGEIENLVFRNTYTQDHYVNVMGGNDKGKYFASFDYYKEDGVIVGSGYKRYSGDLNGSYKVKPNIEVTTGITLSTATQTGAIAGDVNTLYRSMAIWPTFNPWLDDAKTKPNPGNSASDGNPLYWLGKLQRSAETNRIGVNAAAKWDLLPGLFFKGTASGYLEEKVNQSFQSATQTYANIFATPPSFSNTKRDAIAGMTRDFQQQYNGIFNYTRSFAGKNNVNLMAGAEYFGVKSLAMQVAGQSAPTDDIPTANASTVFTPGTNFSTRSQYSIVSTFGRLNYDYDQRYLLTMVFRQDAVSSLPKKNRSGFFPGMSAGWNMHQEAFYTNAGLNKYISTFKPRISYGVNGNVAGLGRYEVQGVYGLQTNYNGQAGFLNTSPVNPELRWEKSKTTDVGADLGFLDNRITVLFDYYNRKTSDLLTYIPLPSYAGYGTFRTNLGTYQNKGYEIAVNANVLNTKSGVTLTVTANASFVKNKILKLPYNGNENNRQGGLQVFDPSSGKVIWVGGYQEGQTLGAIYGYQQESVFKDEKEVADIAGNRYDAVAKITGPNLVAGANGRITPGDVNWKDIDRNDTIDSRDQVYLGNIYPKWTGGFSTNLSYKGFSLYSRFDFATGHTVYNDLISRTLGNYQGTFNYLEMQKNAWSPTNTSTDIPKVYFADQVAGSKQNYTRANNANPVLNGNNSRFYEKGDYLACREITLSYNFPKTLLSRTKVFSQARIYGSLNNLFYITGFSGPSPEPPVDGNGAISGVYQGTYPTPKSVVLGVQVSF